MAEGFLVSLPAFTGSLSELVHALRTERLAPAEVDLSALVGSYLVYYREVAAHDLELATETLPGLARLVELKTRLLLPRPPREVEEDREETMEAVLMLEAFEAAIGFLRERRESRRLLLSARTPRPEYPRRPRPLTVKLDRLAELASRHRASSYFELAAPRLTLTAMMARLRERLRALSQGSLQALSESRDWPTLTVSFTAMLELVKEGEVRARQEVPYGPIELERCPEEVREVA